MLHQLIDPRGEYLENYRCDGCQILNISTKVVYITQLSSALIIQLNIFKCIRGINKKVIPNLSVNDEIVLWGNTVVLSGVIMRGNNLTVDIIHQEFRWIILFIRDTTVLRQKKFQCKSRDVSFPYVLIYERRNNLLMPPSNLLNDTAGILSSDSAPDIMIRQSVIKELLNY